LHKPRRYRIERLAAEIDIAGHISAFGIELDGAASDNAVKAVTQACQTHGVPLVRTGPLELGDAIGKPSRMAAVVTEPGLAARVTEIARSQNT
jgi:hypothetical protein